MNNEIIKQLDYIQNNISRMNQCSFQIKGWTITLFAAFLALYVSSLGYGTGNKGYILSAVGPVVLLCIMDSYYLNQERKYRALYDVVVLQYRNGTNNSSNLFDLSVKDIRKEAKFFVQCLFSVTIGLFYGVILISLVLSYFLVS